MKTVIFCWGNAARADDGIGPLLYDRLTQTVDERGWHDRLELVTDYQLQVEHALDMRDADRVLFVDASREAAAPFALDDVVAHQDHSFTTHALSPQSLLAVYEKIEGCPAPPSQVVAIRGHRFELGESISDEGRCNMEAAWECLLALIDEQA